MDFGERIGNRSVACRPGPARAGCTNKANFGKRTGRGADYAKQSQTWAGWDIWGMARQRGANYEKRTQSADPGPGGYGPGDLTGGAFSRANCAKQTQFAFEPNEGQVLWGKGVMVNCTYKGHRKNKPNCPKRGTEAVSGYAGGTRPRGRGAKDKCAKRTQFARQCRAGRGQRGVGRGTNVQNEPNSRLRRDGRDQGGAGRRTNAQNEPNLPGGAGRDVARGAWDEGQMCKTNPISESWPAGGISQHCTILSFHHSSPMPIVPNEANSRQGRMGRGPRGVRRGAIVQNKANFHRECRRVLEGTSR
jgi:hypothetical protein